MKNGDFAGLAMLQRRYGQIGVQQDERGKFIVMISAEREKPIEMQRVPLSQNNVFLKIECNFKDLTDTAQFLYSLDGKSWISIGPKLKMTYTLPHFMGYRFGLFNYATKQSGGYVDFDFFRIEASAPGFSWQL
jgi:beta-xylosidase